MTRATSRWLLPLLLLALVASGCSSDPSAPAPPTVTAAGSPTVSAAPSAWRQPRPLSPERVVGPYAASRLVDVVLVRRGDTWDATSSWSSTWPGHEGERAILVTDRSGSRALRWTQARAIALLSSSPPRDTRAERVLAPLLVATATSLAPGTRAVVAGGDGATLLPFERVARDTGSGWEVFDVPRLFGDEMAHVSGQVVLPDGRLLVDLPAWSGDRFARGKRPAIWSRAHHGLWVSDPEDWSSWEPFTPRTAPDSSFDVEPGPGPAYSSLGASTRGDGAVWFVAQGTVLASPDGRVFRPVRLTW